MPAQTLTTTAAYVGALDGYPMKFEPGARFSYSNSGFVVLALLAERASGIPFEELVEQRVCGPAAMQHTPFLRSDVLPGGTAIGYLHGDGLRTNVFHLPLRGSGDGGIYSTVADVHALWDAFFAGRIVSSTWVEQMVRPRSDMPDASLRYGLGFWLMGDDAVMLEGMDFGVSFRSVRRRGSGVTYTVVSNTQEGAWPLARHLAMALS